METFDISYALEHITVLVDTREQPTIRAKKRLESMNLPYERKKLDFGDYSAKCTLPDDREVDFSASLAVERKMNIDEICNCFCHERRRFVNEFEREDLQRSLPVENERKSIERIAVSFPRTVRLSGAFLQG